MHLRKKRSRSLISLPITSGMSIIVLPSRAIQMPPRFVGGRTTNWELSSARASAARRVLEKKGIDSERIARVVGLCGSRELFIKDNPLDPRNRRISIILLQQSGQTGQTPPTPANIPQPQPVGGAGVTAGQTQVLHRERRSKNK